MTVLNSIGVYQIKNNVSNKVYVGSTQRSFKERWRKHKYLLRNEKHPNLHLQSAWNKYGEDSFTFSILEISTMKESCIDIEQKWIDEKNAFNKKFGYNMAPVAGSNKGCKYAEDSNNVLCRAKEYTLVSPEGEIFEVKNLNRFCRENGLSQSAFAGILNPNRPTKSHKGWRVKHKDDGTDLSADITGNKTLHTHNGLTMSIADWAKHSGINYNTVLSRLGRGSTIEEAISDRDEKLYTYGGVTQTLKMWSESTGMKLHLLSERLRNGWDFEKSITTPSRKKK